MKTVIVWFRHDLRVHDNLALTQACNDYESILPIYIFDNKTSVLGEAQCWWLHHSLQALTLELKKINLTLVLRQGQPFEILDTLTDELNIHTIVWNRHYEPLAVKQDSRIKLAMEKKGLEVKAFNSCYLINPEDIKNKQGGFFKVCAPFWQHCLRVLTRPNVTTIKTSPKLVKIKSETLSDWNLLPTQPNWASDFENCWQPGELGARKKLKQFMQASINHYDTKRNFPAVEATSRLSPHLHFGEISPQEIMRSIDKQQLSKEACDSFLRELGWREFSNYLLYHYPSLDKENYKPKFDHFPWERNSKHLRDWQKGMTGYPIVDAGMRELWATGYMHNRLRMITASFLIKDLLIDWRTGAAWFLNTLVDADLASNTINWQWVSGSGIDASIYTRVFNPLLQSQRFDPDGDYIRQWVPELSQVKTAAIHSPWSESSATKIALDNAYPKPIVEHQAAKSEALYRYKKL